MSAKVTTETRLMVFIDVGTMLLRIDDVRSITAPDTYRHAQILFCDGTIQAVTDLVYGKLIAALATHPSIQIHRLVFPAPPFEPGDDEA